MESTEVVKKLDKIIVKTCKTTGNMICMACKWQKCLNFIPEVNTEYIAYHGTLLVQFEWRYKTHSSFNFLVKILNSAAVQGVYLLVMWAGDRRENLGNDVCLRGSQWGILDVTKTENTGGHTIIPVRNLKCRGDRFLAVAP